MTDDNEQRNDQELGWLAGNTDLFRDLFNNAGLLAGIYEATADDYCCLMGNAVLTRLHGLPPGGMRGKTGRDLGLTPAEISGGRAAIMQCQRDGPTTSEFRRMAVDGERWFLTTYTSMPPGPEGRQRAALIASDITVVKQAQLQAERQKARLSLALDAATMGVWDYDVATDVVSWDERTGDLFGLGGHGEVLWEDFLAMLLPEDGPRILEAADAAMAGAGGGFYRLEHRILSPGGVRWVESSAQTLFGDDGAPTGMMGAARDITGEVRGRERQALLLAEVNHRVKNSLATVQAIARQTARAADQPEDFRQVFEARLGALARAHDVLGANDWASADLGDLVRGALEVFGPGVRIEGGPRHVTIPAERTLTIAVILHELGTNAVKYGALSVPHGSARVGWRLTDEGVEIRWQEQGGPTVRAPSRSGFGTRLLRSALSGREGWTELLYNPEGVQARITVRRLPTADEAAA